MTQISSGSEQLSVTIRHLAENMDQIASGVEQTVHTVHGISETTRTVAGKADELRDFAGRFTV